MFMALLRSLLLRRIRYYAKHWQNRPSIVDRIELNHYWWVAGCESHQVIIWQWSPTQGRYTAVRFFFLSGDGSDLPERTSTGSWRFTYHDKLKTGRVLVFETADFLETVTAHDPWNRARAA